jgi:FkbM family methyltransferase
VVLDLGANIGYYTLIAANIVGENGEVFAFEPETDNFSILEKNIKLNGYKSITAVQKAVSDKTGKARLYLCREDSSMHSIYGMSNNQQFVEIETVRLDDYFKNYNNSIDFIKIDIEGAEALALQGMSSILKKNKNLKILTEFNPFLLKKSGIKPEKYLESLVGWNFKLYHIHEKEKKLELVTVKELMNKCPVGEYTNLLCSRNFIYC